MNRSFALAILGGRYVHAGVEPPALELPEIRSFVQRALGGRDPRRDPRHLAVEDGFRVVTSAFPVGCGGSTARTLHLPWERLLSERRLLAAHEWLHGCGAREALDAREADYWYATAVLVQSSLVAGGLDYPGWFEGAIHRSVPAAGRVISGAFVLPDVSSCVRVREIG